MKNHIPACFLTALGAVALAFAGCNKHDRADATASVQQAARDTQSAVAGAWDDVKSFTFEKRDAFSSKAKSMAAQAEVQVSELRANYSEAQASASRKAAMEELKNSEADYKAKLDALGHASADTWEAAKNNVLLAWDKLQASYRKARAS
jgi:hypothetical protein